MLITPPLALRPRSEGVIGLVAWNGSFMSMASCRASEIFGGTLEIAKYARTALAAPAVAEMGGRSGVELTVTRRLGSLTSSALNSPRLCFSVT